jgi:hypothetical protein
MDAHYDQHKRKFVKFEYGGLDNYHPYVILSLSQEEIRKMV